MKRIESIVKLLLPTNLVIDIGCDHGLLGIQLLQQAKAEQIWNVDLHKLPLKVAQKNFAFHNLTNQASFFCCDGFSQLPKTHTSKATLVCAGLGTRTILKIIAQLPNYVTQIIFLTHTLGYGLRQWAQSHNWYVYQEAYVREGDSVYELIYLVQDVQIAELTYVSETELWFGKLEFYQLNQNKTNFLSYWSLQAQKITKIPQHYQKPFQTRLLELIKSQLWNQNF